MLWTPKVDGPPNIIWADHINKLQTYKLDKDVMVRPEDFGAAADWNGVTGTDNTIPLQNALNFISTFPGKKLHLHLSSGIYMYTGDLVVRNLPGGQHRGGWTLSGEGFSTVLYQTGAGKSVLEIGCALGEGLPMEGVTLKDMCLVGTTGTLYGLYLNEVARSHFSNLYIMADEADLALKGCLMNSWCGVKLGYAAFNENPIVGITIPTNRRYGLFTLTGSLNSYTTNAWLGLVIEGHTVGGMFVEGGSTNTYSGLVVEGETGYGILSSSEWDVFDGVYNEAITGDEFTLLNTQKVSISNLFSTSGKLTLSNASFCSIKSAGLSDLFLSETSTNNTFIGSRFSVSIANFGTNNKFINCLDSAGDTLDGYQLAIEGWVDLDIGNIPFYDFSENLLGGGLEEWLSATALVYWQKFESGTSTVNREDADFHGGAHACRLDIDASNNKAYIYRHVTLPLAGLQHRLSFWYKTGVGKTGYVELRDTSTTVFLQPDGTWAAINSQITIPDSNGAWALFSLVFLGYSLFKDYTLFLSSNSSASSSLYLDDISIGGPGKLSNAPLTTDGTDVDNSGVYKVGGNQVVGARVVDADLAYAAPSGATALELAVAALINVVTTHGLGSDI